MGTLQAQSRRHIRLALAAIGISAAALVGNAASMSGASASAPMRVPQAVAPPLANITPSSDPVPHGVRLRRFRASVGPDLSESLRSAGVPDVAARDYVAQMLRVDKFASEVSVDDRFDLVVTSFPGEPAVLVYAGMDRVGRGDLQFLKYGDDRGRVEWVDARGLERRESGGFVLPVGGRVTSGYGTRMHPLLRSSRFHRGIDLAAAAGTAIRAADGGAQLALEAARH